MCFGLLLTCVLAAGPVDEDRALLERVGMPVDGEGLVAHFRRLTPNAEDERRIADAISRLSDEVYAKRREAAREIIDLGPKAIPALNRVLTASDAEAAHRAQDCIDAISREHHPTALAAAIRKLIKDQPVTVTETLFEYYPFADELVADDLRSAFESLAREPRLLPVFHKYIKDQRPETRAAAAAALARSRDPRQAIVARQLLTDKDAGVRVRVASTLMFVGDREAVRVLIDSLDQVSQVQLLEADDLLTRIAVESSPEVECGTTPESVRAYQKAWREWWAKSGAVADLTVLNTPTERSDVFWVALLTPTQGWSIAEANFSGKTTPRVTDLKYPVAFERQPRGRFLIAEYQNSKLIDRDAAGKVYWEQDVTRPIAVQRVPGGKVFTASRTGIMIFDRDHHETLSKPFAGLSAAARRRDGTMVVVTANGLCHTLDPAGTIKTTFGVGRMTSMAGIQALPGGRVLIPEYTGNRVIEYDATGRQLWSAEVPRPYSAFRRANGNTVVSSSIHANVVELDRAGKVVRTYTPGENQRPLRIMP